MPVKSQNKTKPKTEVPDISISCVNHALVFDFTSNGNAARVNLLGLS